MSSMDRAAKLREFLQQNPDDSFARYGLALEHANRGDLEAALAEFRELLRRNPDYTAAYQMAAQTLMKAGRNPEARDFLKQGVECAARTGNAHALAEMETLLAEIE